MKLILFQGDSITDTGRDFNYDPNTGYGYVTMTAGKIAVDYPGQFRFLNRGISVCTLRNLSVSVVYRIST